MKVFLSSIFSFDSLRVHWKIPRCVLFAAFVICIVEILFGRTDFFWKRFPRSDVTTVLELEEYIIPKKLNPAVLIFGSSRARGAFLPTLMEQQMGLQRGQVLNFGIGGDGVSRTFDALKIYQRNRDILGKADIMIIELDAGQFNSRLPPTNERFRYLMSFSDWLEYKGEARLSLLRSCVFKLPDVFPYIREYIKYWLLHKHAPKPVGIDKYGRLALVRIANDIDERLSREDFIRDAVYSGNIYKYSKIYEGYLKKLVSIANDDGLSVYIVQIPFPEKLIETLKTRPTDPYGQFTKNISNAVINLADSVQFWEAASEVGLSNQDFRDIEHLNTGGAIKWTTFFVKWLKTNIDMETLLSDS